MDSLGSSGVRDGYDKTVLALLSPVHWRQLEEGRLVCVRQGKVAFGTNRRDDFPLGIEPGARVLLYAAYTKPDRWNLDVTWEARFMGTVSDVEAKHRPAFRNHISWDLYYCVENLNPREPVLIRDLVNRKGRRVNPLYIPRRPTAVQDPGNGA
jgi:hypothetical protein